MGQRIFRSDDTSPWPYGFGDGSAGDLTISSSTTISGNNYSSLTSDVLEGNNDVPVADGSKFSSGDIVLIHQARGAGAGNVELNKVASISTNTLTMALPLVNDYNDDGGDDHAQVIRSDQYKNITIDFGAEWRSPGWSTDVGDGGVVFAIAKGKIHVSNGTIHANGGYFTDSNPQSTVSHYGGFRFGPRGRSDNGRAGFQGGGNTDATSSQSTSANGNGGGGGANSDHNDGGGGGGHAGAGGSTGTPAGGSIVGSASLKTLFFGGGGGGGAVRGDTPGVDGAGAGGWGGGIVFLIASEIEVDASNGYIRANGGKGQSGRNGGGFSVNPDAGGGGGGAGGSILLKGVHIDIGTSRVTATGGSGGSGINGGDSGGAGSVGRIHADYSGSFTGASSPSIDTTEDATIKAATTGGYFLSNFI